MFKGFSRSATEFMAELRIHNEKEWFEPRKEVYMSELYRPMKELCAVVSGPFMKISGMMAKAGRIYSDPNFPPYRKYRDNMWIVVKHETYDWSKTPSLFFEFSAEGAVFGMKLTYPSAAVMENFRQKIISDEGVFFRQAKSIERAGIKISGDEYKRLKPCPVPEAERFFRLKNISMTVSIPADDDRLYSPELADHIIKVFKKLLPVNELFEELAAQAAAEKLALKTAALVQQEISMPEAPKEDFMW
ncbi:MAG: DUF2461 family protein [Ruminococcus sp.]|nr:DUF2461 family protein [Ruminococcus sp.]